MLHVSKIIFIYECMDTELLMIIASENEILEEDNASVFAFGKVCKRLLVKESISERSARSPDIDIIKNSRA